jgi:glyoxylase-like metal-dependent hydrolase (beta-lactamase superfamily II)
VRLADGFVVAVGNASLKIIALRGHTPGSIALRHREPSGAVHLFTGDSSSGGPRRTTSPADFTSLMDDLEQRVFEVHPDDTWVYPGHGDDTTLGADRNQLPEWRARGW